VLIQNELEQGGLGCHCLDALFLVLALGHLEALFEVYLPYKIIEDRIELIEDALCDLVCNRRLAADDLAGGFEQLSVELAHVFELRRLGVRRSLQEVRDLDPPLLKLFDIHVFLRRGLDGRRFLRRVRLLQLWRRLRDLQLLALVTPGLQIIVLH